MTEPSLPAGMRANRPPRAGLTGSWFQAPGPAGADRGVLRFNLDNAPAGAPQRLAAAIRAVNGLDYSGFLPTGDLLQHEGGYWLVTAQPASPTLIELARSGIRGIDVGSVATIVNETAQSLVELHNSGLCHGGIQGETVIITNTGAAKLAEPGLLPALRGDQMEPSVAAATDRRAWAELVRAMVVEWGGSGAGADLIRQCAQIGEKDLAAAVQALHAGSSVLPKGFSKRGALLTAVASFGTLIAAQQSAAAGTPSAPPATGAPAGASAESEVPTNAVPVSPVPAPPSASAVPAPPQAAAAPPDEQQFATRMAKRAGGVQSARSPMAAPPMATPAAPPVSPAPAARAPVTPAYPPGPYTPAPQQYAQGQARVGWPPPQEMRVGPGVSRNDAAQSGWQPTDYRRRSPAKIVVAILSAVVTLAVVAYIGASIAGYTGNTFLQLANFVKVTDIKVDAPQPPAGACNVAIPLTGTFATNGNAGYINFQWEFAGAPQPFTGKVFASRGTTRVQVHAIWNIQDQARDLAGTLRLRSPGSAAVPFTIKYSCKK